MLVVLDRDQHSEDFEEWNCCFIVYSLYQEAYPEEVRLSQKQDDLLASAILLQRELNQTIGLFPTHAHMTLDSDQDTEEE